jgi:hypothetical protein
MYRNQVLILVHLLEHQVALMCGIVAALPVLDVLVKEIARLRPTFYLVAVLEQQMDVMVLEQLAGQHIYGEQPVDLDLITRVTVQFVEPLDAVVLA